MNCALDFYQRGMNGSNLRVAKSLKHQTSKYQFFSYADRIDDRVDSASVLCSLNKVNLPVYLDSCNE